ncbi:MAG: efflux RND transporter permease subunit, partial [Pirellulaceae bacterium]
DVEVSEETLRAYGLSLQRVADIIRRENIELPGGSMKTASQEVLLRGKNKGLTGEQIAQIPLVTKPDGVVLTVGDIGVVKDEFTDDSVVHLTNGRPSITISVDRTASEDLLRITTDVHDYVRNAQLPPGYELVTWQDASVDVRDRIRMLQSNGLQGLLIVFVLLALFMDLRLAFWVSAGIPISLLGAAIAMYYFDQTINMISLFGFLMTLGIVVDDAIVVGENIHARRQRGEDYKQAAINGTSEVLPSVIASVLTTVICFVPLFFVAGVMGKFIAVLPLVVIAMLVTSLLESAFSLPVHLAHRDNLLLTVLSFLLYPLRPLHMLASWLSRHVDRGLEFFLRYVYQPSFRAVLLNPAIFLSAAIGFSVVTAAFVPAGITPWVLFPELDSNWLQCKIVFPDGTPASVTDVATRRLEEALREVDAQHSGPRHSFIRIVNRSVGSVFQASDFDPNGPANGSHSGVIFVELTDTSQRDITSTVILTEWRKAAGEFAGVESLVFDVPEMGPGGNPIEFKMLAPAAAMKQLEEAVEACKAELADARRYPGVVDIADDSRPGKWEYQLTVRDTAKALGVTAADLAETVRASYYGAEAMRLQRGRHEVKLMVRYPSESRRSVADFEEIRVRASDGSWRPLTELADVRVERGYSELNRVEQLRSITVTADVLEAEGNAREIIADFQANFLPELLDRYPGVRIRWEGQQSESAESVRSLAVGFVVAIFAMFVLLAMEFRSYFQPLIVLAAIPFGIVGAIWGHAIMGLPITMFSMFGLVTLAGVVVNDSIVMVDFINARLQSGATVGEALQQAGSRRLRPILLTSVTTIGGLFPLIMETSFQAQVLIPMAVSLCFGLAGTTLIVLYEVPVLYSLYARFIQGQTIQFEDEAASARVARIADEPADSLDAEYLTP